jgi:hypothetical protein
MRFFRRAAPVVACLTAFATQTAVAAPRTAATTAARLGGVVLQAPARIAGNDTALTCFDGSLSLILNPGCFMVGPIGGDCVSHAGHYFIQYLMPSFTTPHRIAGFGFISNDQSTVFPHAGIVLIPSVQNRFPTPAELAALQVPNVATPHDTAVVIVDLRQAAPPLVVTSGTDVVVCLQFPEGGTLTGPNPGVGPGIAVDEDAPDQDCDFLTLDGGVSYSRNDFGVDPLDWGFEVVFEPALAVETRSWSDLKRLYGGAPPLARLYRDL